ncbi:MAG: VOC family protein [Alphaproteobacteria bacterium]|nr:VOC family protein [Alphaproteobacteria bacterium]
MKINTRFDHYNFNVTDLSKSIAFYDKALGLKVAHEKKAEDGSFILTYLKDEKTNFLLELTWLRDWNKPYNLGDNEFHLCMKVEGDYDQVRAFHKEMGCVVYENEEMGLYFIEDPDGYWIEILPLNF